MSFVCPYKTSTVPETILIFLSYLHSEPLSFCHLARRLSKKRVINKAVSSVSTGVCLTP